jgi:hypothetical protein
MRGRCAHQSIDRSDINLQNTCFHSVLDILCLKQHSIRPSYVNNLQKPSLKRMQNHQDIGRSTYRTTVCSVGEQRHRGP